MNQLLYVNMVKRVIEPLNALVEWDRYGLREDSGFVFGWIKRDDGGYDFVSVDFRLIHGAHFAVSMDTSSKKYSRQLAEILTGGDNYVECRSASEIPEAKLVKWQQKAKRLLSVMIISMLMGNVVGGAVFGGINSSLGDYYMVKPHKLNRMGMVIESTAHAKALLKSGKGMEDDDPLGFGGADFTNIVFAGEIARNEDGDEGIAA